MQAWPFRQTRAVKGDHGVFAAGNEQELGLMNGQPRRTVRRVLQAVALYPDRNELKAEYPELEDEDMQQALEFAARNLDDAVLPVDAA